MSHHRLIGIGRRKLHTFKYGATLYHQHRRIFAPGRERVRGCNGSHAAHYFDDLVFGSSKATLDMRQHVVLKTEYSTRTYVYSLRAIRYFSLDMLWFGANKPTSGIDAVTANVEQCTAAELGVSAEMVGPVKVKGKRECAMQEAYVTQFACS